MSNQSSAVKFLHVDETKTQILLFLGFCIFFIYLSLSITTDGSPDFKIYHYYNGYSAWNDRSGKDIAAAQLQTYFFNGLDAVYYILFAALNNHPKILNAVLAIPYGIAAYCVMLTTWSFRTSDSIIWRVLAIFVAIYGVLGSGIYSTFLTTMSDVVPAVPLFVAIALWFTWSRSGQTGFFRVAAVGVMAGISVGLKLTLVTYFMGFMIAIFLIEINRPGQALLKAIIFSACGFVFFAIIDAHWLLRNYAEFGNPIFPLMNNIFKSDFAAHASWTDERFKPDNIWQALFYPAYWAFQESQFAIELNMRDARILILLVSVLITIIYSVWSLYKDRKAALASKRFLMTMAFSVFCILSYALWEMEWSIYRYLTVLEAFSGVVPLVLVFRLCSTNGEEERLSRGFLAALGSVLILAVMVTTMKYTHYPWWSRAKPSDKVVSVQLPPIEDDAMVLFLDAYAYSWLIPEMPKSVRAIGVQGNITGPGREGKLEAKVEDAIRSFDGPLWGLEYPNAFKGAADNALNFYGLHRTDNCSQLISNVDDAPFVRICALERN
ncbi:hypothetical protein FJU08_18210 [Martelella alba]|uniref:Glycosyltransferase RgtA/B/C/D-like domain-containing protein n=1 Tax=Martelella alba TaxID=2590451 RepID=A0A506U6R4_9HYPH|nr:hypothetical protein [Martelella alba]TPW28309.1 hypothetical protein FJU08_18210 [Martelella alba]